MVGLGCSFLFFFLGGGGMLHYIVIIRSPKIVLVLIQALFMMGSWLHEELGAKP